MIYQDNLVQNILLNPFNEGADCLKVVSGYARPSMVSWHIDKIETHFDRPINIQLIIGMCVSEGLEISAHEGFKSLVSNEFEKKSKFTCQYVYQGNPVHSKLYLWEKNGVPFKAFMGSANYTQTAFSKARREILCECDKNIAKQYYDSIEQNTICCNHAEIEEYIKLIQTLKVNYSDTHISMQDTDFSNISLSLLSRNGEVGEKSGLNWGQRPGREPNQAYIHVPAEIVRSEFFPTEKQHFSVLTDDKKQLILRLEQANNKAITTPLNNSLLGEYFRNRIGVANGAPVFKQDLEQYGRTNVIFYKLDEEQYFMDFHV